MISIPKSDPSDYGYIHRDDLPDLDAVADWVLGVLEAVYETGDRDALDNALEELAYELNIPFNYLNAPNTKETKNEP